VQQLKGLYILKFLLQPIVIEIDLTGVLYVHICIYCESTSTIKLFKKYIKFLFF
jgi:hypothetical protein